MTKANNAITGNTLSKEKKFLNKYFIIFNAVWFQAIWWLAILKGNSFAWLLLLIVAGHFLLTPDLKKDLQVLKLVIAGLIIDQGLYLAGVYDFHAETFFIPFWLACLWIGFVISLNHSLHWSKKLSNVLFFPLYGIAGMLSYLAAERLGAVEYPLGMPLTMLILAVVWGFLVPLMIKKYFRHN